MGSQHIFGCFLFFKNMFIKIAMSGCWAGAWHQASSKVDLLVNLLKNLSIMPLGIFLVITFSWGKGKINVSP